VLGHSFRGYAASGRDVDKAKRIGLTLTTIKSDLRPTRGQDPSKYTVDFVSFESTPIS